MNFRSRLVPVLGLVIVLGGATACAPAPSHSKRFIIKAEPQSLNPATATLTAIHSGLYSVEFPEEHDSGEVAGLLGASAYEYIEPDYVVHATFVSDDPLLSRQWAHSVVQSARAWDISRGNAQVVVAVLDTGVDWTHPDLIGNIWTNPDAADVAKTGALHGWNFVGNNANIIADDAPHFHGTHVAGTLGAVGDNGVGISGSAQNVRLMPLKFMGADGNGFTSDAIRGIDFAITHKARIINNSWGGPERSDALAEAIERARKAGILFVAAAGNDGTNNDALPFFPAGYPSDNIIRVAATDNRDELPSWSNYGPLSVDLAAPGLNIFSTMNGGQYQVLSGTSMAAPLVSGVLATMEALRPTLPYLEIKKALLQGVDRIPGLAGKVASGGRVNAFKALSLVR